MLTALLVLTVVAMGYALYKHLTLAGIKAEVVKLELEGVTEVKDVLARLKAKL